MNRGGLGCPAASPTSVAAASTFTLRVSLALRQVSGVTAAECTIAAGDTSETRRFTAAGFVRSAHRACVPAGSA